GCRPRTRARPRCSSDRHAQPRTSCPAGGPWTARDVEGLALHQRVAVMRPDRLDGVENMLVNPTGCEERHPIFVTREHSTTPSVVERHHDVQCALGQPPRLVRADDELGQLIDEIDSLFRQVPASLCAHGRRISDARSRAYRPFCLKYTDFWY